MLSPRMPRVPIIDRIPGEGVQGRLTKHLRDGAMPALASPDDLGFPRVLLRSPEPYLDPKEPTFFKDLYKEPKIRHPKWEGS